MAQKTKKAQKAHDGLQKSGLYKEIYVEYPPSGKPSSQKPLLIKELALLWLKDIKNVMRPSSYARYQNYYDRYILPYMGEMQAGIFNKEDLSRILGSISGGNGKETPLSQHSVYFVESIVRSIFRYGAENRLVPEIDFGRTVYKIKNKKDALPLSELDIIQFMRVVKQQGLDVQVQVMLPLYAGLSLSELCGLKWEDIDLETGKIHVHRNLVRVQKRAGKKDKTKETATIMTESELPENECREFTMPENLTKLLDVLAYNKNPSRECYVAELNKKISRVKRAPVEVRKIPVNKTTDISGSPPDKALDNSGNITGTGNNMAVTAAPVPPDGRTLQYRLKVLGEQAGIQGLGFQALRDTFALMCLNAGGDVYSIAYVLGISAVTMCERYGQWVVRDEKFLTKIK